MTEREDCVKSRFAKHLVVLRQPRGITLSDPGPARPAALSTVSALPREGWGFSSRVRAPGPEGKRGAAGRAPTAGRTVIPALEAGARGEASFPGAVSATAGRTGSA